MIYMRYAALIIILLLVISCPRPTIKEFPQFEYLREAARIYSENPLRAYHILKDIVSDPKYASERNTLLLRIYLDQREYGRAVELLDSTDWAIPLSPFERNTILIRTRDWMRVIATSEDELLKGIAYYNLDIFDQAIEHLSRDIQPEDYRLIYLAKAYLAMEDYENALRALFLLNSISDYLFDQYQDVLYNTLLELPDLDAVQVQLNNLKDPALRTYIMLKVHEKRKNRKKVLVTAWNLIIDHPKSPGAYQALEHVQPKTEQENRAYGRVLYYNNEYTKALKYLRRGLLDDAARYYLGRIYYDTRSDIRALKNFEACSWSAAYYYRGRIYERMNENARAISVYDTLADLRKGSEYAVRGLKRKAFLLEDIGDTLNAVETFLRINERNTKLRAAMQLFRIGDLRKALRVLENHDAPEFIYWQIRIKERLAEPVESLQQYLPSKFPLSYYTLGRYGYTTFLDTLRMNVWINQFGDTTLSFTHVDSIRMKNAIRLFALGEYEYAIAELKMIEADNPQDLIHLSRLCAQYGADEQSIRYCLTVKSRAAERNIYTLPRELLKLQYPIRYAFTIMDNYPELTLSLAMIWQESLFDPYAVSPANAKGLMQIIPSTAKMIAAELGTSGYSYSDPVTSIRFGMHYFKKMLQEFNSIPLSLAAYNAGPIRVRRWVRNDPNSETDTFIELIPYDETRNYVKYILARQQIYRTVLSF
jgi:soluble lytic murein transglycosylase-like protein